LANPFEKLMRSASLGLIAPEGREATIIYRAGMRILPIFGDTTRQEFAIS